ncbi:hypothetical protein [Neomegalonema perideroedes]|uniref:hypothetical protein n=1 Tax=Neomegalonema perideroedes TaxID=217219 RepID=UPI00036665A2|nr:hypothetical protein [Neomegalonema perideroedes]
MRASGGVKALGGGARALLKWTALLATPLMLGLLLALILSSALGRSRTFVIDAMATGAEIHFEGAGNSWPLGEATLCEPLPRPQPRAPRGEGLCDARLFTEKPRAGAPVVWSDGARALLRRDPEGGLVATAYGAQGLPEGTRLHLTARRWAETGALVFTGWSSIGGQMASGETAILISGRYEAREGSLFGLGGATETVKSGDLRRGERVSLVDRAGNPASGFGHVSAGTGEEAGFHVVAIAKPGVTALRVEHLGGEGPSFIRPNWIDYALTSPFFVALALILSMLVGVGQLVLGLWEIFEAKPEARPKRRLRLTRREAPPEEAPPPPAPEEV